MFSKQATKIDEIFTVDLMLCSKRQINGEDFVNFCAILRKYEVLLLVNRLYEVIHKMQYVLVNQNSAIMCNPA